MPIEILASADSFTRTLAVVGAVTGSFSALVTFLNFSHDRSRLNIRPWLDSRPREDGGEDGEFTMGLDVSIANVGRRPTTIADVVLDFKLITRNALLTRIRSARSWEIFCGGDYRSVTTIAKDRYSYSGFHRVSYSEEFLQPGEITHQWLSLEDLHVGDPLLVQFTVRDARGRKARSKYYSLVWGETERDTAPELAAESSSSSENS
jgi:hypothetical protein